MSRFFGKLHRDMNRVNVFAINRCINEGYGLIRIFIEQIRISLTKLWRVWVYINDLEEGVTGKILKFADDTKLFRKVKEIGDKQNLQDDIDKLVKWSEKWQMLFNFWKCKCLHTRPGNTGMNNEMGGTILSKTVKEKDLGPTGNNEC